MTLRSDSGSLLKRAAQVPRRVVRGFLVGWGYDFPDSAAPNEKKPHHGETGFRNLHPHARHNFRDFCRWQLRLGKKDVPVVEPRELPRRYVPRRARPNIEAVRDPDPDVLQVTWIGHTTFLIQAGGVNILTDPIFSKRCSPVRFAGPRRKTPPGLHPSQLPRIDAVVISHDHYDHLDKHSIRLLGDTPRYFFPLGISAWFRRQGFSNYEEKDWGETANFGPLTLHCLPAQHFSGRTLFDRNKTLWCSWMIRIGDKTIYFLGDTGYAPFFKEAGELFGPIDCAIIPIGAYRPRWYMHPVHVDVKEAVQIHKDVRSRFSIASHWGTFELADDPASEAPLYLQKVAAEEGLADLFRTLHFGETIRLVPRSPGTEGEAPDGGAGRQKKSG